MAARWKYYAIEWHPDAYGDRWAQVYCFASKAQRSAWIERDVARRMACSPEMAFSGRDWCTAAPLEVVRDAS